MKFPPCPNPRSLYHPPPPQFIVSRCCPLALLCFASPSGGMSSPEMDTAATPIVGAIAIDDASPLDGVAMIYGAAPHVGAARLIGATCLDGVAHHDEADDVNEPDLYQADDVKELDEVDDPFPSSQVSFRINFDGEAVLIDRYWEGFNLSYRLEMQKVARLIPPLTNRVSSKWCYHCPIFHTLLTS
jgi:hypothetical protein